MSHETFDHSMTAELEAQVLDHLRRSGVSPFPSPEPWQVAGMPPSPLETGGQPLPRPRPTAVPSIARRSVGSAPHFHRPGRPVPDPPPVPQRQTHETLASYYHPNDSIDSLVQPIQQTAPNKAGAPGPGDFPD